MGDGRLIVNTASTDKLSRLDVTILAELASGESQNIVARRLGMSSRTIRRRLRQICNRLEVEAPIEAVAWAARRRII
jgi:DNA-binding NarL/FixJ family response regulator